MCPSVLIFMVHASFEIKTPMQFFKMFKEQTEDFNQDNLSSGKAIVAFILGFHLREWIWKKHRKIIKSTFGIKGKRKFEQYINDKFPYFPVVRDICNGSKHLFKSKKDIKNVVSSYLKDSGAFEPKEFSPKYDTPALIIKSKTETIIAILLINSLVKYYDQLFNDLGIQ